MILAWRRGVDDLAHVVTCSSCDALGGGSVGGVYDDDRSCVRVTLVRIDVDHPRAPLTDLACLVFGNRSRVRALRAIPTRVRAQARVYQYQISQISQRPI